MQTLKSVSGNNNNNGGNSNNNMARPQEDKFSQGARADRDDSLVGRLTFSKGISAFLQAQDTQMCEFWNLWYNTGKTFPLFVVSLLLNPFFCSVATVVGRCHVRHYV